MPSIDTPAALLQALDENLARIRVPPRKEQAALGELFRLFTQERARLPAASYLDDPRLRRAYLRYYLPLNAARAASVLGHVLELAPHAGAIEDVVDLGAGPGSASLASLFGMSPRPSRRFLLTDKSRRGLEVARELLERVAKLSGRPAPEVSVRGERLPLLPPIPRSRPVLLWLSLVLNEITAARTRRGGWDPSPFFDRLRGNLAPASIVVIVEPALRLPARRLLEVHDRLLADGGWRVIAPCTHQNGCPLLRAAGRSWCHFHFTWRAPPAVSAIAAPLGLSSSRHSLSYLALERTDASVPVDASRARVIGDPMRVHGGGTGVYVCAEGERRTLRDPPGGVERGDVLEVGERPGSARLISRWSAPRAG